MDHKVYRSGFPFHLQRPLRHHRTLYSGKAKFELSGLGISTKSQHERLSLAACPHSLECLQSEIQ